MVTSEAGKAGVTHSVAEATAGTGHLTVAAGRYNLLLRGSPLPSP